MLKQFIIEKTGQAPPGLDMVLDHFTEVHTKRKEVLVEVNSTCKYCYFIVEGCLQTATYNYNGDESTIDLAFEQQWRTAMRSFINRQPSNERIVAIEPSRLLAIHRDSFQQLVDTVPPFEYIYKELLQKSYTASIERIQTLMSMDALERLRWLLAQHPMIFTRLSNRLIASYLGLQPATLSRLKAKL
ncbi:MAG: Crp/Fnr family transcriptional regulator [Bacteroidota bacterium]